MTRKLTIKAFMTQVVFLTIHLHQPPPVQLILRSVAFIFSLLSSSCVELYLLCESNDGAFSLISFWWLRGHQNGTKRVNCVPPELRLYRIASSKTFFNPFCVNAEHSRYLNPLA